MINTPYSRRELSSFQIPDFEEPANALQDLFWADSFFPKSELDFEFSSENEEVDCQQYAYNRESYSTNPDSEYMNSMNKIPADRKSSLFSTSEDTNSHNLDDCSSMRETELSSPQSEKKSAKSKAVKPKRVWDEEDEQLLLNLGTLYKNDWKKIAKRIYKLRKIKKTPSWLRKRFKQVRSLPGKKRQKFTHEEDLKLIAAIDEIGMNWIKIAETFPNREAIMLKNRYYSHIRKYNLIDELLEELQKNEGQGLTSEEKSAPETEKPIVNNQPVPEKAASSSRIIDFSEIDMFFAGDVELNKDEELHDKIHIQSIFYGDESKSGQNQLWNFLNDY